VVLWDVATRQRLAGNPLVVEDGVSSVAFGPDGKTIAAGYDANVGGGVVLWDVATRQRLRGDPLVVKEGKVFSVAFSPDGKTIAAGYNAKVGGGVVLWDAPARKRLVDDPFVLMEAKSFAFSPDSKTIAAGYNHNVVLCDADLESWRRRVGRIVKRNFTRDEWREYFPGEDYRPTFCDLPIPPETDLSTALAPAPAARDKPQGNPK
jgi:WD40 repeat protein